MANEMVDTPNSRPNPDPTTATNNAVDRAMRSERDYVDGRIAALYERLSAMDQATMLRLQTITNVPELIDEKVGNLKALTIVKFDNVDDRFKERDTRGEREARDNKVAVDAAFSAQKEAAAKQDEANQKAIDKSEKATNETITKNADAAEARANALADKIDDLKERMDRSDASRLGNNEATTRFRTTQATLIAFAGVIATALIVARTFIVK